VFSFESLGKLKQHPGNYSIYLEYKEETEQAEKLKQEAALKADKTQKSILQQDSDGELGRAAQGKAKPSNSSKPKKLSYKEKREYASLEEKIPELEEEKETLEKQLYTNPPSDYNEMQSLSQRLADLDTEIEAATERWMELAERAE
jgi:ATP-binding cassette subfamily F protein uup